jgi:hypothetical protein
MLGPVRWQHEKSVGWIFRPVKNDQLYGAFFAGRGGSDDGSEENEAAWQEVCPRPAGFCQQKMTLDR